MGAKNQLRRKKRDKGRATYQKYGKFKRSRAPVESANPAAIAIGIGTAAVKWTPRQVGKKKKKDKKGKIVVAVD